MIAPNSGSSFMNCAYASPIGVSISTTSRNHGPEHGAQALSHARSGHDVPRRQVVAGRELRVQLFEDVRHDLADRQVAEPLPVGRDDVPRRDVVEQRVSASSNAAM